MHLYLLDKSLIAHYNISIHYKVLLKICICIFIIPYKNAAVNSENEILKGEVKGWRKNNVPLSREREFKSQ